MSLTRRGENLVAAVLLVLSALLVIGAAWLGQEWKRDRLDQEANTHVGVE